FFVALRDGAIRADFNRLWRLRLNRLSAGIQYLVPFRCRELPRRGKPEGAIPRIKGTGRPLHGEEPSPGERQIQRAARRRQYTLAEIRPLFLDERKSGRGAVGGFVIRGRKQTVELLVEFESARGGVGEIVGDEVQRLHA